MAAPAKLGWGTVARRVGSFALLCALLDLALGSGLAALLPYVRAGLRVGAVSRALAAEAEIVILGSSQAQHSYDDEALSRMLGVRVHNAGIDGHGILFARGLLDLISQRRVPKIVLLDVTFSTTEREGLQSLAPYYGRSPIVDRLLASDWRQRVKLMSRSYRMNGVALSILGNLFADGGVWGFEPLAGRLPENVRIPAGPERKLGHLPPSVEESLFALVEEARMRGSEVVFAQSPTFGRPRPRDVLALYERIAASARLTTLPIASDELRRFGPAHFRDPGHLNREGAAVFTAVIAERLRPVFAGSHAR